jgi:glutamyl-tRNA reductase
VSVLVVGLSHRSAPVDLLERVALSTDGVVKLLHDVLASDHATEAMVLSTCNRVEVYAEVDKFHGGLAQASELLARRAGVDLDELTPHLYVHYEDRAVSHLFSVACGLDSMVVGESQVLGQVRVALRTAQDAGAAGRQLGGLAQQALRVGKRARTETGIDRAGRSLVTAGLEVAGQVLGPLDGTEVLVVGAGAMSALAATVVAQGGAARVVVANRTLERAERVAAAVGGEAVPLDSLQAALASADLVVSCTGAVGHVLDTAMLAAAVAGRPDRPLVVLDLALPRDVDPLVGEQAGVTYVDLDVLRTNGAMVSDEAVRAATAIVADELHGYLTEQQQLAVAPTVTALRARANQVIDAELSRLDGRLPGLDDQVRREVTDAVRRAVEKVLHAPTVRVKELASTPGGDRYAAALRELFDLDQAAVESVAAVKKNLGGDSR